MTVTGGRPVVTPGEVEPYKVVLEHAQTNDTEHAVASMREGEALIRSSQAPAEPDVFDFGSARGAPQDDTDMGKRPPITSPR